MSIRIPFTAANGRWRIGTPPEPEVYQLDDNAHTLSVVGDLPEGYVWTMYVSVYGKYKNSILLTRDEEGASVTLTAENLAYGDTKYFMQLVGVNGDITRKTNEISVYIPKSLIDGDADWPDSPDVFEQAQEAVLGAMTKAPKIVNDIWYVWDATQNRYESTGIQATGADGKNYGIVVDGSVDNVLELKSEEYTEIKKTNAAVHKNALDISSLNCHNLLNDYTPNAGVYHGITFTPTGDGGVHVSGTSTDDSFYNFYHDTTAFPGNLTAGKTYRAFYDGSDNVKFQFWFYKNGAYLSGYRIRSNRDDLAIPSDATGVVLRLAVDNNVTVDETVHPVILASLTNAELTARAALYPSLTDSQKSDILNLISAYEARKSNIVYDYNSTRISFLSAADIYDSNNKLRLCCDTFAELIWGGVSPETFPADSGDYTGAITKAFSWGYFDPHLIRQRTVGLAERENGEVTELYGYRSVDSEAAKSYSFNTRYAASGSLPNSQVWLGGLNASDLANALYLNGYEVPASKADVGDLVFYESTPYASVSSTDSTYNAAFRRIFHVAVITARINGFFEVTEVTSQNNGADPVVRRSIFSADDFCAAKSGFMQRYAIMFARHPAAFGVAGNVPSRFNSIPTRL